MLHWVLLKHFHVVSLSTLGTQECRHHFAALAIVQKGNREEGEGEEDVTLAEPHWNSAVQRKRIHQNWHSAPSFPLEGQQQLISQVPVSCVCVTLKNTYKTWLDQVWLCYSLTSGWLRNQQYKTHYQYIQRKIIVNIPENIALYPFYDKFGLRVNICVPNLCTSVLEGVDFRYIYGHDVRLIFGLSPLTNTHKVIAGSSTTITQAAVARTAISQTQQFLKLGY